MLLRVDDTWAGFALAFGLFLLALAAVAGLIVWAICFVIGLLDRLLD